MPPTEPPTEPSPSDPGRHHRDDLQARIDRARGSGGAARGPGGQAGAPPSGLGAALRLSTELFAGVVVGFGIGWFLDRALGTSPFGAIVFVLIGFAAGTVNLVRSAARPKDGETVSGRDPGT